jgi:hypothetical protein
MSELGVIVAIPSTGKVRTEWSLMFRDLAMPMSVSYAIRTVIGKDVVEARNLAVQDALEKDAEYLFFLDSDVLVPRQGLHRMFYAMQKNPDWDLLTGIVTTKTTEPQPCIFKHGTHGAYWDWTFPNTFEIDACGMACALIRMETVKKMAEPWFDWPAGYNGAVWEEEGEDTYFCRKLSEIGGKLMADGGVLCGHLPDIGPPITLSESDPPIRDAAEGAFENTRVLA